MGYYMRMDLVDVAIKPKHLGLVENAIRGKNRKTKEFQYMLESLEVDPDGYLQWSWRRNPWGPVQKHHHDEELAAWLSRYCAGGLIVYWSQEGDGAAWAYEFDGEGGVTTCSARRAAAIKGWSVRRNPERETARIDREIEAQRIGFEELRKTHSW